MFYSVPSNVHYNFLFVFSEKAAELITAKEKDIGITEPTDQPTFQDSKDPKLEERVIKNEENDEKIKCEEPKNGVDTPMVERGGGDSFLNKAEGDDTSGLSG